MPSLNSFTLSLLALLLTTPSSAQDSPQCSEIEPQLAYNASASLTIPALNHVYLGSDTSNVRIMNETAFNWTLSSYVQPAANPSGLDNAPDTETVLWLDTAESNTQRLGGMMRMCHNFVPLQIGRNLTWSKEVLEKSVDDTGDCRALVSEACLDRLQSQYQTQANQQRAEYTACINTNNTVPWECEGTGMAEPISRPNPDFNASLAGHFGHPNTRPLISNSSAATLTATNDTELVCAGRNFSQQFGTHASIQDYDVGTNFALMDIMTFFSTSRPGTTFRLDNHRVQIACLVPGPVVEGSRAKASVQDTLDRYNSTGGDETSGARVLGGVEAWRLLAWALGLGVVFAC